MGRKIPAKKHRGVKDPLVQQARRLQSIKGKINAPPKDPDEQPVPQSLTRLFAFQNRDKIVKKKKNTTQHSRDSARESDARNNPIAHLKRLPGESGRGFSLRINSAVRALQNSVEQGYQEDMEQEDAKGERMSALRERRQRKRKRAGVADERAAAPRGHRLTLKKQAQRTKAAEEAQWAQRTAAACERVRFGEVAHAPPALPAPRHASASARPACRGLLLSAMLGASAAEGAGVELLRERARLEAVAAYRALKKERRLRENSKRKIIPLNS